MSLSMTERDKKLLYGLTVFVVTVLALVYLLRPALERLQDVRVGVEETAEYVQALEDKAALLDGQREELAAAQVGAENAAAYFLPIMTSDEIDKLLTERILLYRLDALQMTISTPENAVPQPYIADGEKHEARESVQCAQVDLRLGGTVKTLQRLTDYWSAQNAIEIESLRWGGKTEDTQLLELTLRVYMAQATQLPEQMPDDYGAEG